MKKKIFTTFFFKAASAVVSFFIVVILSQVLGASGRGEASIILTTISIILIFMELCGGGSLIYLIPRNNVKSLLLTSYTWSFLISIISYILLYFLLLVREEYVFHIVFLAFLLSISGSNTRVLIAKEKLERSNLIQFLQIVIVFISLILLFFVFENRNIESYITGLYVSAIISIILSFKFITTFLFQEKKTKSRLLFKESLQFGSKNQIAHIAQFLSYRGSYYIIEKYWGMSWVGIYSNGVSIAESIWLFSRSIALVQVSKITNSIDDQQNRFLTITLARYTTLFSILLLIPLVVLPDSFYVFLFGNDFNFMSAVIMTLAPGIIFYSIALIIGHYFSGNGRYEINAFASIVGLVITFGLGLILIPQFSIWGAGITASLSYFSTMFIVGMIFFKSNRKDWIKILPNKQDVKLIVAKIKKISN